MIVSVAFAVLPAPSCAVTVMTVVPVASGIAAIDHDDVPLATPLVPRLVAQLICVTATLSLAVPLNARVSLVAVYVAVVVGVVSATVGAVLSGGVGTVNVRPDPHGATPALFDGRIHHCAAPAASETPGLTLHVPGTVLQPAASAV